MIKQRFSCFIINKKNTIFQDLIKEKEKEIETLRKERDVERERVTKAANQADEADKKVVKLQKDYEKVLFSLKQQDCTDNF